MKETIYNKDLAGKKIHVRREFAGGLTLVWRAWTERAILDQWWAPKPYQAITKSMDFKDGGEWFYCMLGPKGDRSWVKVLFAKIEDQQSFEAVDHFCDEDGKLLDNPPPMLWKTSFSPIAEGTVVSVEVSFSSQADMEAIISMGFEQGFAMAHENLDQYLTAQAAIRRELKTTHQPRVSTYLNFPGNAEAAFNFYKTVFGIEFSGRGIQRFEDIPADPGHPPLAEEVKKMVLHAELPILGGHVLMATDSPKQMGFNLSQGNNMHICLEPSTKAHTKELFDALSAGGTIIMPLADMFFGSYFGTCTDQFGINWMFNCIEQ